MRSRCGRVTAEMRAGWVTDNNTGGDGRNAARTGQNKPRNHINYQRWYFQNVSICMAESGGVRSPKAHKPNLIKYFQLWILFYWFNVTLHYKINLENTKFLVGSGLTRSAGCVLYCTVHTNATQSFRTSLINPYFRNENIYSMEYIVNNSHRASALNLNEFEFILISKGNSKRSECHFV